MRVHVEPPLYSENGKETAINSAEYANEEGTEIDDVENQLVRVSRNFKCVIYSLQNCNCLQRRDKTLDKAPIKPQQAKRFLTVLIYPLIRKLIQLTFIAIAILIAWLYIFIQLRNKVWYANTAHLSKRKGPRGIYNGKPAYEVMLTGDSLNLKPWVYYDLGGRIQSHLPSIPLLFRQESLASYTMVKMKKVIPKQIAYRPDFVFICSDTDVSSSGYQEWRMTQEERTAAQTAYRNNMASVIDSLKKNTTFFAFAGPLLLGEHKVEPLFYGFSSQKIFANKKQQLADYVKINEDLCEEKGVKYINLNKLFTEKIPAIWPFASWYVTVDGEHPNRYGTQLMAREYALAIKEWLQLPDSVWRD